MTPFSVTVIVPTFNRANYINECIDSLLAQTVPALEVIVVDDGSDDDTAARIAVYGQSVRYVRKANGGKPSAVNMGLGLAQGQWIWIFDDDDVALPDAIALRLAVLAQQPAAGFVYSSHQMGSNGPDQRIKPGRLCVPPHYRDEDFFLEIMRGCFFSLSSALVRRELYEQLGGLDPMLLSSEDYDFQIRLARVTRPAFCATPSFVVRQHDGLRGAQRIRYAAAQRSQVFRRDSQAVGHKIRADVALAEFLCPPKRGPLMATEQRAALLHRLHVMANHGCLDEFVADLTAWLQSMAATGGWSEEDRNELARAYRRGWIYDACCQDWTSFLNALAPLKRLPGGRASLRALGRSVFGLALMPSRGALQRLTSVWHCLRLCIEALT
jgi:glycosyltransferase involved in cell wall biosynthesis